MEVAIGNSSNKFLHLLNAWMIGISIILFLHWPFSLLCLIKYHDCSLGGHLNQHDNKQQGWSLTFQSNGASSGAHQVKLGTQIFG